jgi:hypothetical protein
MSDYIVKIIPENSMYVPYKIISMFATYVR